MRQCVLLHQFSSEFDLIKIYTENAKEKDTVIVHENTIFQGITPWKDVFLHEPHI